MKNVLFRSMICVTLIGTNAAHAAPQVITLNNATACQVTVGPDGKPKGNKKVRSVDVYSMYYASNKEDSYSYYGTIAADTAGIAVISQFTPSFSPIMPSLNINYAPSPGYLAGSYLMVRTDNNFSAMNNWYVYQEEVYDDANCRARMRIAVADHNPCV
jgi:hypothetical protein